MLSIVRQLLALFVLLGIAAGTSKVESADKHEEAEIVHFDYGAKDWSTFFEFEKGFKDAISAAAVGEYDGNELTVDGSGSMYIYGPDADKLFAFVKPRLLAATFLKNVIVTLRYGSVFDPSARKKKIELRR
jgi:hypothetical protein